MPSKRKGAPFTRSKSIMGDNWMPTITAGTHHAKHPKTGKYKMISSHGTTHRKHSASHLHSDVRKTVTSYRYKDPGGKMTVRKRRVKNYTMKSRKKGGRR
jgi:hypothetical protein